MGEIGEKTLDFIVDDICSQIKTFDIKPSKIFVYCGGLDEAKREYFAKQMKKRIGNGTEISTFPGKQDERDRHNEYAIDLHYFFDIFTRENSRKRIN